MTALDKHWTFHLCLERGGETVLDTEIGAWSPEETEQALEAVRQLLDRFGPEAPVGPAAYGGPSRNCQTPEEPQTAAEEPAAEEPAAEEAGVEAESAKAGAGGLLTLRCESCGSVFTTWLVEPKRTFLCKCGGELDLTVPLARFRYHCPNCGKTRFGRTNVDRPTLEVRCGCGSPISLTWVPKLRMYRD